MKPEAVGRNIGRRQRHQERRFGNGDERERPGIARQLAAGRHVRQFGKGASCARSGANPAADGVSYTRSVLIKALAAQQRGISQPKLVPRKLDPAKQPAFIDGYENLLNNLGDDEAVVFADAVHPTHEARPAGCWAPKDTTIALEGTA